MVIRVYAFRTIYTPRPGKWALSICNHFFLIIVNASRFDNPAFIGFADYKWIKDSKTISLKQTQSLKLKPINNFRQMKYLAIYICLALMVLMSVIEP